MRHVLLFALIAACAAPTLAEDHQVSQEALATIGLADMQAVSVERGEDVRGKFSMSFGQATSLSYVSGVFHDPHTGTYEAFGGSHFGSKKTFAVKDKVTITAAVSATKGEADLLTVDPAGNTIFSGTATWKIFGFGAGASLSFH